MGPDEGKVDWVAEDLVAPDHEAERGLIGAILSGAKSGDDIIASLSVGEVIEMMQTEHRKVADVLMSMHSAGEPLAPDAVARRVCDAGLVRHYAEALAKVDEYFAPSVMADHYADRIAERAARRLASEAARNLQRHARSDPRPPLSWLPGAVSAVTEIRASRKRERPLKEQVDKAVEELLNPDSTRIIRTGLGVFDRHCYGLVRGNHVVVAARPGHGKTAFAVSITLLMAMAERRIAYFTLEMSAYEMNRRFLSQLSGVPIGRMFPEYMRKDDHQPIRDAAEILSHLPIMLFDGISEWGDIKTKIRGAVSGGAEVVIIDYVGLVAHTTKRYMTQHERITMISHEAKQLAEELQIPIVLLVQLNREAVKEKDREPQLVHLRDAGALEEDADLVLMLHQPHKYDAKHPANLCKAFVRKFRNGPVCIFDLQWTGEIARLSEPTWDFSVVRDPADEMDIDEQLFGPPDGTASDVASVAGEAVDEAVDDVDF